MKVPIYIKQKRVWIPLVLIIIIGGYFWFRSGKIVQPDFFEVRRGDLLQEVSVTGKIRPAEEVDLAFEKSGKIARVAMDVGDGVRAGQVLVALDSSDLVAQLAQARANAKVAQLKLGEMKKGARSEQIDIDSTKVQNAEIALDDAKNNLIEILKDAYTKSDDAIRRRTDQFFTNPRTSSARLVFITDQQLVTNLESGRVRIEQILVSFNIATQNIALTDDLNLVIRSTKENLNAVKAFLDSCAFAVNALSPTSNLTLTTIESWKSDISTARININSALANVVAADEKIRTAESSLDLARRNYNLTKAGSTAGEIAGQEATLAAAEANVQNIEAQISKTILFAPITGIITQHDAKVGEIVSGNVTIVSMIGSSGFEIEANVPEADIAKIKKGNLADVTLDAYGEDIVFTASVTAIDPAETIIDGVPTYTITLQFTEKDDRVKSGMTANIDIATDRRDNVLSVPQRAVVTQENKKIVRVLNPDGTSRDVEVRTGLRGSGGNIEVVDGLHEGDRVLLSIGTK